jgi:hypothetical protein
MRFDFARNPDSRPKGVIVSGEWRGRVIRHLVRSSRRGRAALLAILAGMFLPGATQGAGNHGARAGRGPMAPPDYPYLNNRPMGSAEAPFVLRTFLPNPGLEDDVFANHHHSSAAMGYNPNKGADTTEAIPPIDGIPAAIAINFGTKWSVVFDTTEGRLL